LNAENNNCYQFKILHIKAGLFSIDEANHLIKQFHWIPAFAGMTDEGTL
jgi:hypothetical protein